MILTPETLNQMADAGQALEDAATRLLDLADKEKRSHGSIASRTREQKLRVMAAKVGAISEELETLYS